MSAPSATQDGPVPPTGDAAATVLQRVMRAWELDRFDAAALVAANADDFGAIEWTADRLTRAGYLIEMESALQELNPRFGIAHWIKSPNPGPFFGGNSPLQMMTGSTRGLAELLRQVRRWSKGPGRS